jgi:hypothetical protein
MVHTNRGVQAYSDLMLLLVDKESGRITFTRSEMDWAARDSRYRRLPAAFELEMIVARSDHV